MAAELRERICTLQYELDVEALTKSSSSRPSSMLPIIVSVLGLSRAP
jgi:hypothetical protein